MREQEVKQALALHLARAGQAHGLPVLLEEVEIEGGLTRADIVDVEPLHCYEIKTASDSLDRLLSQGARYSQAFDRVTLVLATKHLSQAMPILPPWWGVIEITDQDGLGFQCLRHSSQNHGQDPGTLASLLKREECLDLLSRHDALKGRKSKPLYELQDYIADALPMEQLKHEIKYYLAKRRPMEWAPMVSQG